MEISDILKPPHDRVGKKSQPPRWIWLLTTAGLGLMLGGCALWAWPESAVMLESTPSGAEVVLGGRPAGQTPLRLVSRPWPLQQRVEVSLAGYQPWSGSLGSSIGESRVILVALGPLDDETVNRVAAPEPGSAVGEQSEPLPAAAAANGVEPARLDPEADAAPRPAPFDDVLAGLAVDTSLAKPVPELKVESAPPPPIYPLAIMVENAPESRPQSGLDVADIVFEAMAEGGISRFMAVYVDGEAAVVGPVRSARHYFVNLAAELGASMAHIGASPLGYVSLTWYGMRDLDETFGHPGFWRNRARLAPHNAYTSVAGARAALDDRGPASRGRWGSFAFKESEQRDEGLPASEVSLDYQPWGYRVGYRFDAATNRYLRSMEGAPHLDAESHSQIWAASIAVLTVNSRVVDSAGRLDLEQVGSGPAVYFLDGVAVEGSWSKPTTSAITRYLDAAGNPIRFNHGPVWVQLISEDSKVTYER